MSPWYGSGMTPASVRDRLSVISPRLALSQAGGTPPVMPPITSDNVTLQCPRADGSGASFQVYTLAEFDDQRQPVTQQLTVGVNSQPALLDIQFGTYTVANQTFSVDPNGRDVKIQTKAPRGTVASATVRIRDGRQDPQSGLPVEFLVNITLTSAPGVPPTIELVTKFPGVTLP